MNVKPLPDPPDAWTPPAPYLSEAALRHLCVALIRSEQDRMLQAGALDLAKAAKLRQPGLTAADIDAISVDADTLGFDSLAMLDLILVMNRLLGLHRTGIEDYLLVERGIGRWVALLKAHLSRSAPDFELGFATSGSMGKPKEIHHSFDRLRTEITGTLQGPLRVLQPDARVIALVPAHHIYGFLFTVLLPTIGHYGIVDLHRAGPGAALLAARPGDLVVGTPRQFEAFGHMAGQFAPDVHGVVSTGPTTPATWVAVARSGLASMTEIFGSTETAGLAARTAADSPFVLMPHLQRMGDGIADFRGPLPLQDDIHWQDDRQFVILGRRDSVVQVAGTNVHLDRVRELILKIDGITDVALRIDRGRLKAFIQTTYDEKRQQELTTAVRALLTPQMPAAALPQSFRFGRSLPRNDMGKLCDWPDAVSESGSPFTLQQDFSTRVE